METIKPQDPNNLTELEQKHWPQIEVFHPKLRAKFAVKIRIGKIPHPMTEEHLIVYIELFYGSQPVGKYYLNPEDEPVAEFGITATKPEKIIAQAFCNLHGLWQNELEVF